jgi:hypothetical protein
VSTEPIQRIPAEVFRSAAADGTALLNAGLSVSFNPDPTAEQKDQRWLIAYQRTELIRLRARLEELKRRNRRRTHWLVAAVLFAGLMSAAVVTQSVYGDLFGLLARAMQQLQQGV